MVGCVTHVLIKEAALLPNHKKSLKWLQHSTWEQILLSALSLEPNTYTRHKFVPYRRVSSFLKLLLELIPSHLDSSDCLSALKLSCS
jgi:hypothetical protein